MGVASSGMMEKLAAAEVEGRGNGRPEGCDEATSSIGGRSGSGSRSGSAILEGDDARSVVAASCLELLGYLGHAAEVARDKFCRFHLGAMVCGCALMIVSILVHVAALAK